MQVEEQEESDSICEYHKVPNNPESERTVLCPHAPLVPEESYKVAEVKGNESKNDNTLLLSKVATVCAHESTHGAQLPNQVKIDHCQEDCNAKEACTKCFTELTPLLPRSLILHN